MRNPLRLSGFTCGFCGSVACFKGSNLESFKHFFQINNTLSLGLLSVQYKPILQFLSNVYWPMDMVVMYDFFV